MTLPGGQKYHSRCFRCQLFSNFLTGFISSTSERTSIRRQLMDILIVVVVLLLPMFSSWESVEDGISRGNKWLMTLDTKCLLGNLITAEWIWPSLLKIYSLIWANFHALHGKLSSFTITISPIFGCHIKLCDFDFLWVRGRVSRNVSK